MSERPVLIAGGGIGGLTLALCLAEHGCPTQVFEQATEFGEPGAGIQLSPNCVRVLHWLGLEEALQAKAFLPQAIQFRHWRSGRVIAQQALGEAARRKYGFPYYHMHRGDLLALLAKAAAHPGIALRTGMRVEGLEQDEKSVTVHLEEGSCRGRALVGADGIRSTVRASLFGPASASVHGQRRLADAGAVRAPAGWPHSPGGGLLVGAGAAFRSLLCAARRPGQCSVRGGRRLAGKWNPGLRGANGRN